MNQDSHLTTACISMPSFIFSRCKQFVNIGSSQVENKWCLSYTFFRKGNSKCKGEKMNWFVDMITNPFLLTSLSGWGIAQVLKVIINAVVYKKYDITRLFGDGGMPSGHSATVSSLATISALVYGTDSFQFAVTMILAIIVCHDAMGVRMETGKQSMVLNEIIESIDIIFSDEVADVKLKEMVGHTMAQVIAGVTLGIIDAIVVYNIFFVQ